LYLKNDAKHQLVETIKWRKKIDVEHIPVATKYNNLPLLMAVRGYKYIDDGNCHVEPELSDSVIRIANCIGGDCFHKFDKEGHPILIDRTVNIHTRALSISSIMCSLLLSTLGIPQYKGNG
jgi:hypothetical protein